MSALLIDPLILCTAPGIALRTLLTLILDIAVRLRKQPFQVTKQEFFDYFAGISASVDTEEQFDEIMRKAWQIE